MKKSDFPLKALVTAILFLGMTLLITFFFENLIDHFRWLLGLLILLVSLLVFFLIRKQNAWKTIGLILILLIVSFILAIGLMLLLDALGINPDFAVKDQLTADQSGLPDLLNNGVIAETEDYVFYLLSDPTTPEIGLAKNALIRRNRDWSNRIELTDQIVRAFAVDENFIYYVNSSDGAHLYRMTFDGSEKALLADDQVNSLTIANHALYYGASDGLYRLDLDSSNKTKLSAAGKNPAVLGDWVYVTSGNTLLRIMADGSASEELVTDVVERGFYDDTLYFTRMEEEPDGLRFTLTLYQLRDSHETEIITIPNVGSARIDGDYLYYVLLKDGGLIEPGLYRIRLDGTGNERLNKVHIWQLNAVLGDWFYILQYNGHSYRIKLDGSVAVELN
ncbi:DUF5050 domain-containing protein [Eubacteriaceae bacterium ES2]|nr:DUF5050 domain-containing protein [Eubacteriaceae bacterium ES2]